MDLVRSTLAVGGGVLVLLVAAIAARWYERRGQKLKTFAVGLEDSPDLLAARAVAEHLGTEHHESVYTQEDALRVLPEVVRTIESFDPSLVRSAVPNYILAEFTARHVKVVLTGEGRSFCAGADIGYMRDTAGLSYEENLEDARRLAAMFRAIDECPKPVVAKVEHSHLVKAVPNYWTKMPIR